MGKVKQLYQDMMQKTDEELWDMLEYEYQTFLLQREAYAYEDTQNPNNVSQTQGA